MDLYPFNLVLAVSVACATIFLGFLPSQTLKHTLLARETLKAAFVWGFIAVSAPTSIFHYPLGVAGLSLLAWWQFRRDEPFAGKMWLSMASGLGISLGVMLLLAVTPFAYPPGKSSVEQGFLLASIYLGGAVIGMAYVCSVIIRIVPEISRQVLRRYSDLLVVIVGMRTLEFLLFLGSLSFMAPLDSIGLRPGIGQTLSASLSRTYDGHPVSPFEMAAALILPLLAVPGMAFFAWRSIRAGSLGQAQKILIALTLLAFVAELLARHLAL